MKLGFTTRPGSTLPIRPSRFEMAGTPLRTRSRRRSYGRSALASVEHAGSGAHGFEHSQRRSTRRDPTRRPSTRRVFISTLGEIANVGIRKAEKGDGFAVLKVLRPEIANLRSAQEGSAAVRRLSALHRANGKTTWTHARRLYGAGLRRRRMGHRSRYDCRNPGACCV